MKTTGTLTATSNGVGKNTWTPGGLDYESTYIDTILKDEFCIISKWPKSYAITGLLACDNLKLSNYTGASVAYGAFSPYISNGQTRHSGWALSKLSDINGKFLKSNNQWGYIQADVTSNIWMMHRRVGNSITLSTSTNSASGTSPDHSSWNQLDSFTGSSTTCCSPYWGLGMPGTNVLEFTYIEAEFL